VGVVSNKTPTGTQTIRGNPLLQHKPIPPSPAKIKQ
jgi:hypothetical protein